MRHHFQDDTTGFGVSAPWWDYVFGTAPGGAGPAGDGSRWATSSPRPSPLGGPDGATLELAAPAARARRCSTRTPSPTTSSCPTGPSCGRARWPSPAPSRPGALGGARVLELGCGLGLPSLAAARGGRAGDRDRLVAGRAGLRGAQRGPQRRGDRHGGRRLARRRRSLVAPGAVGPRPGRRRPLRGPQRRSRCSTSCHASAPEVLLADPGRATAEPFFAAAAAAWAVRSWPDDVHPTVRVHRLRRRASGS